MPKDKTTEALEQRVQELEAELEKIKKATSTTSDPPAAHVATNEALISQDTSSPLLISLKAKEEECDHLQARLEEISLEFQTFREDNEKSVKEEKRASGEHNEHVEGLKTLAAKDRVWLDAETKTRLSASIASRKEFDFQLTRIQQRRKQHRRMSTDF
jgi:hypothetical protein